MIMYVWEAQFWEQSNVVWVLKLWEVTYLGSEDIMSMRMWFLCSSIKNTLLYISEIRMNFGRGNGAAWGRFGLMRDIQWSWRATLPRIFFSPRFLAILTFLAPWCFIILKLTLPWKPKFWEAWILAHISQSSCLHGRPRSILRGCCALQLCACASPQLSPSCQVYKLYTFFTHNSFSLENWTTASMKLRVVFSSISRYVKQVCHWRA